MVDLLTQFKAIIETTGLSLLEVACLVYIGYMVGKLLVYIFKKIKGDIK